MHPFPHRPGGKMSDAFFWFMDQKMLILWSKGVFPTWNNSKLPFLEGKIELVYFPSRPTDDFTYRSKHSHQVKYRLTPDKFSVISKVYWMRFGCSECFILLNVY